jgi:EAL domain-containing protein (putative c-di-GMP-specific phosphodiesterase class I)
MAFQPIIHVPSGRPFAYEALVRGMNGDSAAEILAKVSPDNLYRFDQACREGHRASGCTGIGAAGRL